MGVLNNINYIRKATVYNCQLPGPIVLIETALEAGVPILYELASFSCIDILKTRAGISWRCGKQLKSVISAAHGAKVVDKAHFIYSFAAPVEKALWYWFVADMATAFVANWSSLVYQSTGCIPEDDSYAANSEHLMLSSVAPNLDYPVPYLWHHQRGRFGAAGGPSIFVPRGWYFSFEIGLSVIGFVDPIGGEWSLTGRGNNRAGGFEFSTQSKGFDFEQPSSMTYSIGGSAPEIGEGTTYHIDLRATNWCFGAGGHAVVQMSALPIVGHVPIGAGCFRKDWSTTTAASKPIPHV